MTRRAALFILGAITLSFNLLARHGAQPSLSREGVPAAFTVQYEVESYSGEEHKPSPLFQLLKSRQRGNRKLTAALLAFPFPLGIVGMHRIYLGTAPYVPVVYIASAGGVFGILPLIDFFVIIFEKDLERFVNNKNVFMWVD
jgi:TM2 domain-containing membrane protein YozV